MSGASSNLLSHIRQLMAKHAGDQRTDHQLLERFHTERDEAMFALLVRRHGPMVLSVCRRILGHEQDAEDAFQATFLILARKAGSIRQTDVGGFLYRVAYHVAVRARAKTVKRNRREKRGEVLSAVNPQTEMTEPETHQVVDEELQRLPEDLRGAWVLCYLEGRTQEEAARRLGWSKSTLRRRLEKGRELLRKRLLARGLAPMAALTATLFADGGASATLPAMLASATVRTILASKVSPAVAALAEAGLEILSISKTKAATAIVLIMSAMTGAGMWICLGQSAPVLAPSSSPSMRKADAPRPAPKDKASDKAVTIHGRVLDPDGKPAANARVYVDSHAPDEKPMASATTGKDGRFSFTFARPRLVVPETKFPLRNVRFVVMAKGYGLDWLDVPLADAGKEATLRLVKDDVPIQGRILSLEGKPLAGVKVSVKKIEAFPKGDLNRALQAERSGRNIETATDVRRIWFMADDPARTATTGADGRFRLDGLGRERIVTLNVEGPGIYYGQMQTMTRAAESVRNSRKKGGMIHGATFDYLAKPSRLIRGTVREKGTGKPLAGIRIHDMGFTNYVTAHAETDEGGHYELLGCPKGERYGLMAQPMHGQPYLLTSAGIKDTPGFEPLTADMEMVRGIPCEGRVLDGETGQAVPGNIGYYPLAPNPHVTGNMGLFTGYGPFSNAEVQADGSFRCAVLPGRGCLVFRAKETNRYMLACVDAKAAKVGGDKMGLHVLSGKDHLAFLFQEDFRWCPDSVARSVNVGKSRLDFCTDACVFPRKPQARNTAGTPPDFQAIQLIDVAKDTKKVSEVIRVAVARQVIGTVVDADGKAVAGVRVRGLNRWEWKTLATEKFIVHGVNPLRPRRLHFLHEARRLIGTVEVKGTETKPLTVRLQPWAAVRGRLIDADGQPLRNAELRANEFLPEDGRTDGDGRFRLEGLIPGLRYDFTYEKRKPSASGTLIKGFVGKPGEVRDLGDVRAKPQL